MRRHGVQGERGRKTICRCAYTTTRRDLQGVLQVQKKNSLEFRVLEAVGIEVVAYGGGENTRFCISKATWHRKRAADLGSNGQV